MKNAINRALAAKKNYSKYICLFLMLLGTCAHAWGAETLEATFNSSDVVTSTGYGSSYGYYNSDWNLSLGGGGDRAGFNGKYDGDRTIGNAYGTSANTSYHGFYVVSKNKLDNICKITFTYSMGSTPEYCANAKIYLGYSTDGASWSAISLTSGSQGQAAPPSEYADYESGYNYDTWTFEFSKIASAYYAIIVSANGTVPSGEAFGFATTEIKFYSGCCDYIVTPAKGTRTNCEIAFSPSEVATCSSTAADRQLTVTVTPASCYAAPTADAVARASGVACTKVSGPTDNGDGTYNYVFQFAQNVSGTTTYNATISSKKTYTISYAAGGITCTGGNSITGSHANSTKTCGSALTMPGVVFSATGYTQTGWSTSSCGSQTLGTTGSYTTDAAQTFYPVWTANTISLTLDKNGGDANGSATVKYHATSLTSPVAPTRAGYVIEGYYADAECTHKVLTNSFGLVNYTGYVSGGKWVRNEATTLYANWTQQRTLAVASVANVVISATSPSVAEGANTLVTPGTTVTLSHGAVTSPYTWAGWNVYKTGEESTKVTVTSNSFTMPNYNVTVSAYLYGDMRAFCEPEIDITLTQTDGTSTPLYITSAAGQKVKAIRTLDLTVDGAAGDATQDVTLSGTDLLFYKTDGTQITGSVLQTNASGDLATTKIVVAYAPSAYVDESFVHPTIRVTCHGQNKTFNNLMTGRCLPDQFVIAAKAGSEWVALTARISGMSTQDAIPIRVDNTTTPTKASVALNTSEYSLLGLQEDKPTVAKNRFAANGGAVHLESLITSKELNASSATGGTKTNINTGANHNTAAGSNDSLFYEWKLVSPDLVHYTLTNSNRTNTSNLVLGYSTAYGKWGMYASGANQDLFLLPIQTVLEDLKAEVMEWGTTSMVLRFPSDVTAPSSIKVTLGGVTSAAKTLTAIGTGSDLWKVEGLSLSSNDCEVMQIEDASDASKGCLIRKPILVSGSSVSSGYRTALTDEVCASCDIVILKNGKLTADQEKADHTDFANIYVYPGGKLILDGYSLGAKQQVYVRGGHSWLNTSEYNTPEVYVNGNINFNGSGKIIYDYYIQNYKYYQFCLPYTIALNKVTDEAGVDDFPVWVKYYNGAIRAADASATSWAWYEGSNFNAGIGYIIAARPRQGVSDDARVRNRPLSIIRFPLGNSAFNGSGEATKSVSTTAHGISGYNANPRTVTANNVGWNFVGNPFMSTWKGDIGHQQLQKNPDAAHWDGTYKWADGATKYITVMSAVSGSDYDQYVASETELKPFFPFFFQETAGGGSGTLEFANTSRVKKAPAMLRTADPRSGYVQVEITEGVNEDRTGLFVSDAYTDEIDFDDSEKTFGSSTDKPKVWLLNGETRLAFEEMTESRAAGAVTMGYRAPTSGTYTFYLNTSASKLTCVKEVLLTDHVESVTDFDLLKGNYEFESDEALYNETRFTIRVVLKDEEETPTDLQDINLNSEQPMKFIYRNQLYILRNGVIYDATGRKVR